MNAVGRNESVLGVCASRRQAVRQKGVGKRLEAMGNLGNI